MYRECETCEHSHPDMFDTADGAVCPDCIVDWLADYVTEVTGGDVKLLRELSHELKLSAAWCTNDTCPENILPEGREGRCPTCGFTIKEASSD